jgi:CRP-like cAMP-binding protein
LLAEGQSPWKDPIMEARPAFLSELSADDRERVEQAMQRVRHAAGDVVLRQGDLSTDFFVILDGSVEVERDGTVIATLPTGEVFGEAGAIDAGPGYALARNATVRASTDLDLGVIDETEFRRLTERSEPFRLAVLARLDRD